MGKLEGKVGIVTGAAMGIGLGTTEAWLHEGAKVAMFDYSDKVYEVAKRLESEGYDVLPFKVDISDKKLVEEGVQEVLEKYGRIDLLANIAGIIRIKSFAEMTDRERDDHFLCYTGSWNLCKSVLPHMVEQQYGRIVNMTSVSGVIVVDGGETAYGPAKAAMWGFTKALAIEYAEYGITVNGVAPGYVATPMQAQIAEESDPDNPDNVTNATASATPLGRLADPYEVGQLFAFLASDDSKYITGSVVVIDGGSTLPETWGAVGV
ncbi:MAG TPA: SDR family oxidoreductase [Thermoclostridium sp.]|nr:SDR family oxidoreductase [Thermoclostridium sp.]